MHPLHPCDTLPHMNSHTGSHVYTLTLTHMLTFSHTHTNPHTHSHAYPASRSYMPTHTNSTFTHTLSHIHTHSTHRQTPCPGACPHAEAGSTPVHLRWDSRHQKCPVVDTASPRCGPADTHHPNAETRKNTGAQPGTFVHDTHKTEFNLPVSNAS